MAIIVFSAIAIALLIPGFFTDRVFANLGALYAVGSLLAFMMAHASIIGLRLRQPEMPRPFRIGWNFRVKGKTVPVTRLSAVFHEHHLADNPLHRALQRWVRAGMDGFWTGRLSLYKRQKKSPPRNGR
jgi:hypothetical protein